MKRRRFGRRPAANREVDQLTALAAAMGQSGSRLEDRYWEDRLTPIIDRLLQDGNDEAIETALDQLFERDARGYDALADMIESRAESRSVTREERDFDVLLIAAPVLAWSRYAIPASTLSEAVLAGLRVQLQAHVLAEATRVALADFLFSPDQMPRGYAATGELCDKLAAVALRGQDLHLDPRELADTTRFLSDTRYLIAAVVAPRGAPLFRWREADGSREQAATQWQAQGGGVLRPLLTGCAFELLLPDAYHSAWRHADRDARPYSVRASVAYLQTTLNAEPKDLHAIVAPFVERELEEYRVGFSRKGSHEVLHGLVWALLGAEDERSDSVGEIEAVLKDCGVSEITVLDSRFPLEYCDDCGAPLFPNTDGEAVHAEMPEEGEAPPVHLH